MSEQAERGTRVQVLLAHAGLASRRACEDIILAGRVSLNGVIVTELGTRAMPGDELLVDGKAISSENRKLHLALNKPPGYLCASSDPYGRPLAVDLFKPSISERIYNVGRLDLESCGLILFTNDGDFAAKAGHPSFGLIKEYEVVTDVPLHPEFAAAFQAGLVDRGETLKAEKAEQKGPHALTVWLAEGKNREIRRALELYRIKAKLLRRVAIGPISLGGLAEGCWRALSDDEIKALTAVFTRSAHDHSHGRPGGYR